MSQDSNVVLLIDDEHDMDWIFEQILRDEGYKVMTAKTGAEGLEKFQRADSSHTVVLLDLKLPDINGLKVLKKIKARSPRTSVLMMTAFGTPAIRQEASKAGAVEVLDKPFRVEKVLKTVRLAFARQGGR